MARQGNIGEKGMDGVEKSAILLTLDRKSVV